MKEPPAHGAIGHLTYSCSNTVLGVCEAHELSDGVFLRGRIRGRHVESREADSHSSQASRKVRACRYLPCERCATANYEMTKNAK